jgi:hypothetical protein
LSLDDFLSAKDADEGIQFIEMATVPAFPLGTFDRFLNSVKPLPTFDAKNRIPWVLRAAMAAPDVGFKRVAAFSAKFRLSGVF